jgi:multidrug efflux pump subunit AcrB
MTGPNLSDWAIHHRSFVVYFMIVFSLMGALSYSRLGREEDPSFVIKTMIVSAQWPGATVNDVLDQVTDRIEKKLQETPYIDYIKSYTKPGTAVVYVNLLERTPPAKVPDIWKDVRNKINDIKNTLPPGTQGPYFNDDFGDTYGSIYALTSDGFSFRELRDFAELARSEFLRVKDVAKVQLIGTQDEKVYLDFSTRQLASLGISFESVIKSLRDQNAIVPSGRIVTSQENILIDVSGEFASEASMRAINLRAANDRFYRLEDIVTIRRGYVDPPQKMFRFNGEPAVGVAISMAAGGNILDLGRNLHAVARQLEASLPIGVDIHLVADQPVVVEEAVHGFVKTLVEAIVIVLAVSFLSLGVRAGLVVALSIPLVLGIVFVCMELMGITLQRISLGALIIALGLLVDDAMITVEMMVAKLEQGENILKAAVAAYTLTAFPMLTGTLVTVAGFVPIGFAASNAGEYCRTLFEVLAIALVASWFVAVIFSPLIGVWILPKQVAAVHGGGHGSGRIERMFRPVLLVAMRARWVTIGVTVGLFAVALYGYRFVQQQFFPASDRPEILVEMTLPKGDSVHATDVEAKKLEAILKEDKGIERYSMYVGGGAIRFYLPLDVQLDNDFFAQAVVVTKGIEDRDRIIRKLEAEFAKGFENVLVRIHPLEVGPPVGWPIQLRTSGKTPEEARAIAERVAAIVRAYPGAHTVNFDWYERNKSVRIDVDQDLARQLGISSQQIADATNAVMTGRTITQLRDSIYLIDILARADAKERLDIQTLRELQFTLEGGGTVPLSAFAKVEYTFDESYVWRRGRLPTITVQADLSPGIQAATAIKAIEPQLDALRKELPIGGRIEVGGAVEKSIQSNASIQAVFPVMIFLMLTLLMIQLQSMQRMLLVISVAPLGLIGVVGAMVPTGAPMGFVATLGVISLIGMIVRNSVILVDQIELDKAKGLHPWDAVVDATVHRLRPIYLTALAATLGMIPIAREVFWGPMAYAVIGGLLVATALTLLFLPALYVAWFRIKEPVREAPAGVIEPTARTA